MIKYFCDICRGELEDDRNSFAVSHGDLTVKLSREFNGVLGKGQICWNCIKKCVDKGKLKSTTVISGGRRGR